jgi:hypothetical protein
VRKVPARWWCTLAILLLTAAAASIDALRDSAGLDALEVAAIGIALVAVFVLPAAVGWLWSSLFLACFAAGWAFVLGLGLADLLTYSTVWHRCNVPQLDACDPGPFPETMLAPAAIVPALAAVAGRIARSGLDAVRKGGGEEPHLLIGANGHANGPRRPEGA